jgi:hypothetical protein
MRRFWTDVEALDNVVDAHVQLDMLVEGRRLVALPSQALPELLQGSARGAWIYFRLASRVAARPAP